MLLEVHPALGSSDVRRSVAFFQRLGFRVTFKDRADQPAYLAVTRDGVTLPIQRNEDVSCSQEHDRPVYRFLCESPDQLFDSLRQAGAISDSDLSAGPWGRPGDTPWGTREFHLRDPDGNGLQFYRSR